MLGAEASGGMGGVCDSEASGTSVTVRIDTRVELVGNVRIVRTGVIVDGRAGI
jgi:hypothetical protein